MGEFICPVNPRINGGCAITYIGPANAAVWWEVVEIEGEEIVPARGRLTQSWTTTDSRGRCVNYYISPTDPEMAGKVERIIVKASRSGS